MFSISPYHSVVLLIHIPISYINFTDSFRKQKSAKHMLLAGLLDRLVTHFQSYGSLVSIWQYMVLHGQ